MSTPIIIIIFSSIIIILGIIQILALFYYIWTLCLRTPIKNCYERKISVNSTDSKRVPLINSIELC